MKITYDPETDTLTVRLKDAFIKESDEICEGLVADYDDEGNIVGLEIFDASHRVTEPQNMKSLSQWGIPSQAVQQGND